MSEHSPFQADRLTSSPDVPPDMNPEDVLTLRKLVAALFSGVIQDTAGLYAEMSAYDKNVAKEVVGIYGQLEHLGQALQELGIEVITPLQLEEDTEGDSEPRSGLHLD